MFADLNFYNLLNNHFCALLIKTEFSRNHPIFYISITQFDAVSVYANAKLCFIPKFELLYVDNFARGEISHLKVEINKFLTFGF